MMSSQMSSFTDIVDPRLSDTPSTKAGSTADIKLEKGCHKAWQLSGEPEVLVELSDSNGTVIEAGGCSLSTFGEVEPLGEDGEKFELREGWTLEKGDYHLTATCPESSEDCTEDVEVWLIHEEGVLDSMMENTMLWVSLGGCLFSFCLIPLGFILLVMNSGNSGSQKLMVIQSNTGERMVAESSPSAEELAMVVASSQGGGVMTTDQIYRVMHGDEDDRKRILTEIEKASSAQAIPDPFVDSNTRTVERVAVEPVSEPTIIADSKEEDSQNWRSWDEG